MTWVNEPSNELLIHQIDSAGKHATTQYFVPAASTDPVGGTNGAIVTGVQGMSNGYVYEAEVLIRASWDAAVTPGTGAYDRVQDKAMFVFAAADGSPATLQMPTLNETILDPDAVTIDPTDSLVTALVSAFVTNCVSAQGQAIVGLQRGFRRRPFRLKRQ